MALSDEQILEIYLSDQTARELASADGVPVGTIGHIWSRSEKRYMKVLRGLPLRAHVRGPRGRRDYGWAELTA
jgi:hypothetical protein